MGADARVDILLALKAKLEGFDGAATAVPNLSRAVANAGATITQQTKTIGQQVDGMSAKIRAAFSPVNLAKGFLAGAGIGSGMALVSLTIEKWVDVFKEGERHAKLMDERAASIADKMREVAAIRFDNIMALLGPDDQLSRRNNQLEMLKARMAFLEARRVNAQAGMDAVLKQGDNPLGVSNIGVRVHEFNGEKFGGDTGLGGRAFYELMQTRAHEAEQSLKDLQKEAEGVNGEIQRLQKTIDETKAKSVAKAAADTADTEAKVAMDRIAALRSQIESGNKLFLEEQAKSQAAAKALNAEQDKLAEKFRQSIDPAREFKEQMAQIEVLLKNHKLSAEEAARAQAFLTDEINKSQASAVDSALKDFFEPLDQMSEQHFRTFEREAKETSKVAKELGYAFQSSFEEAILSGAKLSDVLRGLARDIAQIALRTAVTDPIGRSIGSLITTGIGALFGGGITPANSAGEALNPTASVTAAGGGSFVTKGRTHFTVGDNPGGVELVSVLPLSGIGRSTMNGRNVAMAGGGNALVGAGGGDTFNFSYIFQGGVTRAEVMGLLPSMVNASKSAVLEAKRRRRDGFR